MFGSDLVDAATKLNELYNNLIVKITQLEKQIGVTKFNITVSEIINMINIAKILNEGLNTEILDELSLKYNGITIDNSLKTLMDDVLENHYDFVDITETKNVYEDIKRRNNILRNVTLRYFNTVFGVFGSSIEMIEDAKLELYTKSIGELETNELASVIVFISSLSNSYNRKILTSMINEKSFTFRDEYFLTSYISKGNVVYCVTYNSLPELPEGYNFNIKEIIRRGE